MIEGLVQDQLTKKELSNLEGAEVGTLVKVKGELYVVQRVNPLELACEKDYWDWRDMAFNQAETH